MTVHQQAAAEQELEQWQEFKLEPLCGQRRSESNAIASLPNEMRCKSRYTYPILFARFCALKADVFTYGGISDRPFYSRQFSLLHECCLHASAFTNADKFGISGEFSKMLNYSTEYHTVYDETVSYMFG